MFGVRHVSKPASGRICDVGLGWREGRVRAGWGWGGVGLGLRLGLGWGSDGWVGVVTVPECRAWNQR